MQAPVCHTPEPHASGLHTSAEAPAPRPHHRAWLPRLGLWLGLALLLSPTLQACGNGEDEGEVEVTYDFNGTESPTRVSLYLIERAKGRCNTLDLEPDSTYDSERNLSPEGTYTFDEIPAGRWTMLAIGYAGSVPVARDCEQFELSVGEIEEVNLSLRNEPVELDGTYSGILEIGLGQSTELTTALLALDIACQTNLNLPAGDVLCQLAGPLGELLQNFRVKAAWTMNSVGDNTQGQMEFLEIENIPVSRDYRLVDGTFSGFAPGSTDIEITSNLTRINVDEVARFLLEEVLGRRLSVVGLSIDRLTSVFVEDIRYDGESVEVLSVGNDGRAQSVRIEMNGSLSSTFFGTSDVNINVDASRESGRFR
ncbi:MAG: hypothetical protein ACPGUV_00280 [Polyangiales bacterium]